MALDKKKLIPASIGAICMGIVLVLLGSTLGQAGLGALNVIGPLLAPAGLSCLISCFIPTLWMRIGGIALMVAAVAAIILVPVQGGHNNESAGMGGTILFLLLGGAGATMLLLSFVIREPAATTPSAPPV